MSIQTQIDRITGEVSEQTTLLNQALVLIANKTAGSGSGEGVQLPALNNPDGNPAEQLAEGWELIDENGNIVTGIVPAAQFMSVTELSEGSRLYIGDGMLIVVDDGILEQPTIVQKGLYMVIDATPFGDARQEDVPFGVHFSSKHGMNLVGTKTDTSGVTLPELDNPGSAVDLASGKELYDDNGNKVTGELAVLPELIQDTVDDRICIATWNELTNELVVTSRFDNRYIVENNTAVSLCVPKTKLDTILPDSGSGNSPYTKAVEFLWEAPSDIVAGSATVSIPHSLGEEPDGFMITAKTAQWDNAKYVAMNIVFDRSMYYSNFGAYLVTIPGMNEENYFGNGCMMSSNYSDFCTSTHIKIGNISDVVGSIIIPAGKEYNVLVYKR